MRYVKPLIYIVLFGDFFSGVTGTVLRDLRERRWRILPKMAKS
jgi:hypothetical protein